MNMYADIMGAERAASRRPKMPRAERAKLFAPFAALRGFEESAHARERRFVTRPEPAPDRQEQLDRRLRALRYGERVTVTFFQRLNWDGEGERGEIHTVTGDFVALSQHPAALVLTTARVTVPDILDVGIR